MNQKLSGLADQKANIFISYRRSDTAGHTGRLYDRLNHHFQGHAQIFMDLDSIAPGADFIATIETAVGSCNAVIAMIGDQWLAAKDAGGQARLHQPEDFVRAELATALRRNILVIPVLVEGAPMPQVKDLPPDLAKLVRLNALEISDGRWEHDTQRLIGRLEQELGLRGSSSIAPTISTRPVWKRPMMIGAAVLVLLCLAFVAKGVFRSDPQSASPSSSPTAGKAASPGNADGNRSVVPPLQQTPSRDRNIASSASINPASILQSDSKVINLLAPENGGRMLIASTDRWKNTIDGKETSSDYFYKGEFAVFAFQEDKPAILESLAIYVPGTSGYNVKSLELFVGNEAPDGKFESLGQFQLKNYRVVEDPFQKIALPKVKAKYVKIVILSNQEGSNGPPYLYEMRLMGRVD